jgi:hypothetical protein
MNMTNKACIFSTIIASSLLLVSADETDVPDK